MAEYLYALVVWFSPFGWFVAISALLTLVGLAVLVSMRDDGSEEERRRKSLLERADQAADRLDEAVDEIEGRLPGWCLDDDNDAYRLAMVGYVDSVSEIRSASDDLRGRVARGRVTGTETLVRSCSVEAGQILRKTRRVKERCVRHSAKVIAESAVSVLERRLSVIETAMGDISLVPLVRFLVEGDLTRIRARTAAFRDALQDGKDFSESGLIALLRMSVEVHDIQDLLSGIIQRNRSVKSRMAAEKQA